MLARPEAAVNVAPIDRWTVAHGAVGLLYGSLRVPWWGALGLGIAWEILEIGLKASTPTLFPRPRQDSFVNAVGDVGAVMLGWGIAQSFRGD